MRYVSLRKVLAIVVVLFVIGAALVPQNVTAQELPFGWDSIELIEEAEQNNVYQLNFIEYLKSSPKIEVIRELRSPKERIVSKKVLAKFILVELNKMEGIQSMNLFDKEILEVTADSSCTEANLAMLLNSATQKMVDKYAAFKELGHSDKMIAHFFAEDMELN